MIDMFFCGVTDDDPFTTTAGTHLRQLQMWYFVNISRVNIAKRRFLYNHGNMAT